ncbi:MAG: hypothetical protein QME45_07275 [Clostridiales bacterium]|nr:hypothetical protein [Clostridiales bacterium]
MLASIFSIGAYRAIYESFPVSGIKIILVFISLICICLLSVMYPLYITVRISPVEAIMDRDIKQSLKEIFNIKWIAAGVLSAAILAAVIAGSGYYIQTIRESKEAKADTLSVAGGIIQKIDEERMMEDIKVLTSNGKRIGTGQDKAGDYIVSRLKDAGYSPEIDEFSCGDEIGISDGDGIRIEAGDKEYEARSISMDSKLIKEDQNVIEADATVFGRSDMNDFKDKSSNKEALQLSEYVSIDKIMKNIGFLDRDVPYNNLEALNKAMVTPDEMMKLGLALSQKLKLPFTVAGRDNYSGFACIDNETNYSYISSWNEKSGTNDDKIGIIDKNLLKKHTALIYAIAEKYRH